jgi:hypothetical protein
LASVLKLSVFASPLSRAVFSHFGASIARIPVCLLPGTELAFEENVKCESAYGFGYKRLAHKVARFRQVNQDQPNVHHDALELPDGEIVLVTKLAGGQHATVLQMPATPQQITLEAESQELIA